MRNLTLQATTSADSQASAHSQGSFVTVPAPPGLTGFCLSCPGTLQARPDFHSMCVQTRGAHWMRRMLGILKHPKIDSCWAVAPDKAYGIDTTLTPFQKFCLAAVLRLHHVCSVCSLSQGWMLSSHSSKWLECRHGAKTKRKTRATPRRAF